MSGARGLAASAQEYPSGISSPGISLFSMYAMSESKVDERRGVRESEGRFLWNLWFGKPSLSRIFCHFFGQKIAVVDDRRGVREGAGRLL